MSYGLTFLGAHFIWAVLMFLIQWPWLLAKISESIVWAHNKLNFLLRFNHVH
jgi:hypothetical protein